MPKSLNNASARHIEPKDIWIKWGGFTPVWVKEWFEREMARVREIDRLGRRASIGALFTNIAERDLRLSRRALEQTMQAGDEPAELMTHKPAKRARALRAAG